MNIHKVTVSFAEANNFNFASQFQEMHFHAISVIVSKPGPRTLMHDTSSILEIQQQKHPNHITSVPPASSVSQDSKEAFESKMQSSSWEETIPFWLMRLIINSEITFAC